MDWTKEAYKKGYTVDKEGNLFNPQGSILKGEIDRYGYRRFKCRINDKSKNIKVHRLAAYAKYGDEALKCEVIRHLDAVRDNCAWSNLRLGTQADNQQDIPKEVRVNRVRRYSQEIVKEIINSDENYSYFKDKYGIGRTQYYFYKKNSKSA